MTSRRGKFLYMDALISRSAGRARGLAGGAIARGRAGLPAEHRGPREQTDGRLPVLVPFDRVARRQQLDFAFRTDIRDLAIAFLAGGLQHSPGQIDERTWITISSRHDGYHGEVCRSGLAGCTAGTAIETRLH